MITLEQLAPTALTVLLQRWYMEDCERLVLLRPLRKLNEHPMELAVSPHCVPVFSLTLPVIFRQLWEITFLTIDLLVIKKASGKLAQASLSTHLLLLLF